MATSNVQTDMVWKDGYGNNQFNSTERDSAACVCNIWLPDANIGCIFKIQTRLFHSYLKKEGLIFSFDASQEVIVLVLMLKILLSTQ